MNEEDDSHIFENHVLIKLINNAIISTSLV